MTLTIVIPARNEEENIGDTVCAVAPHIDPQDTEIIVVNDHSTDGTGQAVRDLGGRYPFVRGVNNEKEPGFANALLTAFERARGDFVLPMMADCCDDPAVIPAMLETARAGYDLVCGSRYIRGGGKVGGPRLQGFFSVCVGKTLHWFAGIPTSDVSNAFKMYRTSIVRDLRLEQKGFAVSMEAALKFYFRGCRIADVPTVWYGRKKGQSKFKLSKTLPYVKLYLQVFFHKNER